MILDFACLQDQAGFLHLLRLQAYRAYRFKVSRVLGLVSTVSPGRHELALRCCTCFGPNGFVEAAPQLKKR